MFGVIASNVASTKYSTGSPINITANGTASGADTAGHFLTKTIEE